MKRPAIFLDRDGTLIEEVDHLGSVDDLRLFPYTLSALKSLKDNGFLLIVVTNQSGIGRRFFTEDDMRSIHDEMQRQLGGLIDAFYHCPHLPEEGCVCRKPGIGMIEAAARDLHVDLKASWMIGDKEIDVSAGVAADMSTVLVLTGYGTLSKGSLKQSPDFIAQDLADAANRILASTSPKII